MIGRGFFIEPAHSADLIIESRCPLYVYMSPFHAILFLHGIRQALACNKTGLSIGHASILLQAWSPKNGGWAQSFHCPRVERSRGRVYSFFVFVFVRVFVLLLPLLLLLLHLQLLLLLLLILQRRDEFHTDSDRTK